MIKIEVIYLQLKHFVHQLLLVLVFVIPAAAQDISVSPITLTFEGGAGQTVSRNVKMTNSSKTKTYSFTSSLSDWDRDSTGNRQYHPNGSMAQSMSNWIEVSENNFELGPGESKNLTISCAVPHKLASKSAYNSMLFLTQTNPSKSDNADQSGIGILVAYEFGIQVFYNPLGASLGDMEINAMIYTGPTGTMRNGQVQLAFANTGQINKTGTVRLEITNKITGAEIKTEPAYFAIMPQGKQRLNLPLSEQLLPGSYLLVAILDAGRGHSLKIAEKDLVIK
jgi:hypothetical protein